MAPHSSTLAWKIPWTEEPGGLQSMGSLGVGHDWVTSLSLPCIGEGNGNPLQYSCLENPRDGGAWWAAVYGVAQSQTRLKRLSSSSSMHLKQCTLRNKPMCLFITTFLRHSNMTHSQKKMLCVKLTYRWDVTLSGLEWEKEGFPQIWGFLILFLSKITTAVSKELWKF